jgi:membrane-bound serine protease (ClpP class)
MMFGMRTIFRLSAVTMMLTGLLAGGAGAQGTTPVVTEVGIAGVVDPFTASFVKSAVQQANDNGVDAVLITIDTPGGLDSSMREIIQAIMDSDVPVICYVAPSGARAASAGTFILISCPVAAMAPGTNVGAAHPVGVAGAIEQEKVLNDSVAYIRSLAELRGRNADWAEQAVRDSVSISAEQAVQENVVDLVAPDVTTLLNEVDGQQVAVAHENTVTLHTAGATVTQVSMNPFFAFLHALLNPDLAFLFFWLGIGLIILEIFVPGGVLGTIGALMLIIAIVSFGMLPVQLVGIALLIASVVFFILELKHPGLGAPAIGGAICLIAGGLLLFDPSVPNSQVSRWLIGLLAIATVAFFSVVVRSAMRLRNVPPVTSPENLVGQEAVVLRRLHPEGVVRLGSEEWTAVTDEGPIHKGTHVTVTALEGLRLRVEPVSEQTHAAMVPLGPAGETEGGD